MSNYSVQEAREFLSYCRKEYIVVPENKSTRHCDDTAMGLGK
jgi:hypothetical protein